MNRQYGALSGIAVALVVLNHAIHFGMQLSPLTGPPAIIAMLGQGLGIYAVPAFLFISGAFLSYASREMSLTFVRRSLDRILWPYVIWSVAFFALVYVVGSERYSIPGYVKNLIVGYPYHFVPLLAFWYVAAPLVVRIGKRHPLGLLTVIGVLQLLLIILRYPRLIPGLPELPGWVALLQPPVLFTTLTDWAVYFPLGLVLSMHDAALKPRLLKLRGLLIAATVVLFVLAALFTWLRVGPAPLVRLLSPLPLMFLLPVINRTSIPLLPRFEMLGRRSYGIYLAHFVAINALVFLIAGTGVAVDGLFFVVGPVLFVLALSLPVVLMDAIARVPLGRSAYRFAFGAVPPPPALETPRRTPSQMARSASGVARES